MLEEVRESKEEGSMCALGLNGEARVVHETIPVEPRVNVKLVKNTKGFNWEVTVLNATSVEEALVILREARAELEREV